MTSKQSQSSGGSGGLHGSAAPVRALVQQYRAHGSIESLLLALQHPISMRVLRAQQRSDSATSLLAQMPLPSSPEPFHQPLIEHLPTLCRDLHESYRWWLEEYRLPSAVELRIASLNAIRLLTILARCRALELSTATQLADSISQQAFATAGHLQSLHQPLLQPPPQTQSACSQQFELRKDREMQIAPGEYAKLLCWRALCIWHDHRVATLAANTSATLSTSPSPLTPLPATPMPQPPRLSGIDSVSAAARIDAVKQYAREHSSRRPTHCVLKRVPTQIIVAGLHAMVEQLRLQHVSTVLASTAAMASTMTATTTAAVGGGSGGSRGSRIDKAIVRLAALLQQARALPNLVVQPRVTISIAAPPAGRALRPEFVPRPALQEQLQELVADEKRILLYGEAGAGKSAVAQQILDHYAPHEYPLRVRLVGYTRTTLLSELEMLALSIPWVRAAIREHKALQQQERLMAEQQQQQQQQQQVAGIEPHTSNEPSDGGSTPSPPSPPNAMARQAHATQFASQGSLLQRLYEWLSSECAPQWMMYIHGARNPSLVLQVLAQIKHGCIMVTLAKADVPSFLKSAAKYAQRTIELADIAKLPVTASAAHGLRSNDLVLFPVGSPSNAEAEAMLEAQSVVRVQLGGGGGSSLQNVAQVLSAELRSQVLFILHQQLDNLPYSVRIVARLLRQLALQVASSLKLSDERESPIEALKLFRRSVCFEATRLLAQLRSTLAHVIAQSARALSGAANAIPAGAAGGANNHGDCNTATTTAGQRASGLAATIPPGSNSGNIGVSPITVALMHQNLSAIKSSLEMVEQNSLHVLVMLAMLTINIVPRIAIVAISEQLDIEAATSGTSEKHASKPLCLRSRAVFDQSLQQLLAQGIVMYANDASLGSWSMRFEHFSTGPAIMKALSELAPGTAYEARLEATRTFLLRALSNDVLGDDCSGESRAIREALARAKRLLSVPIRCGGGSGTAGAGAGAGAGRASTPAPRESPAKRQEASHRAAVAVAAPLPLSLSSLPSLGGLRADAVSPPYITITSASPASMQRNQLDDDDDDDDEHDGSILTLTPVTASSPTSMASSASSLHSSLHSTLTSWPSSVSPQSARSDVSSSSSTSTDRYSPPPSPYMPPSLLTPGTAAKTTDDAAVVPRPSSIEVPTAKVSTVSSIDDELERLKRLVSSKQWEAASKVVQQLQSRSCGELVGSSFYTLALTTYMQLERVQQVRTTVESMLRDGRVAFERSSDGGGGVIEQVVAFLVSHEQAAAAESVLRQYAERTGRAASRSAYTHVVQALARNGEPIRAERLVQHMAAVGVAPDRLICNVLIHGFSKAKMGDAALRVYHDMAKYAVEPDRVTFSSLIDAMARASMPDKAREIFEQLRHDPRFGVDLVSCNSLIHAYAIAKENRKAEGVFELMIEHGITPDSFTYSSLINAHAKVQDVARAAAVFATMRRLGFRPDAMAYSSLINAMAQGTVSGK